MPCGGDGGGVMKNKILSCYRNLKLIYGSLEKYKLLANVNYEKGLIGPYLTNGRYDDLVTIECKGDDCFHITANDEDLTLGTQDGIDYLVTIMPRLDMESAAMFLNHASECGRFIAASMPYVAIDHLNQVPEQERYTTDAAVSRVSPRSAVTTLGYSENIPVSRQMAAEGEDEEVVDGQKQKKKDDSDNAPDKSSDKTDDKSSDGQDDIISDEELDAILADDDLSVADEDFGTVDESDTVDYSRNVTEGSVLQEGNSILTVTSIGKDGSGKDVAVLSNNTEMPVEELEANIESGEWQKVASLGREFRKIVAETLDSNILYYNQLMLMKDKVIERLSKINQAIRWVETRKGTVDSASPEYSQITKDESKFKEDLKYYTNIIERLKDKIVDYQSLQSRINIEREVDLQEFYGLLGIENNVSEDTELPTDSDTDTPDLVEEESPISEEDDVSEDNASGVPSKGKPSNVPSESESEALLTEEDLADI